MTGGRESIVDYAGALNPEQHAAVVAPDGPQLVLAAAGTGKTRTVVCRVAHLVERGIRPEQILLLTFTNRAAREMLERAVALVGDAVGGVWAGTFHHMANRILRRHSNAVGYESDYVILDRDDARGIVSDCVKQRELRGADFPKPDVLISLFSAAANTKTPVAQIAESRFSEQAVDIDGIVSVHNAYETAKDKLNAMDFDDLLTNCLKLFRENDDVIGKYRKQFVHVLVDEYQDTNTIQAELVDLIAEGNRNLFVVGDDFQSIYSWRGANFKNILSFPERYPDTGVYKLERNYRSVPDILELANACIAGNPRQFQKTLRATRQAGRKPLVSRMRDGGEQARYVLERVREFRRNGYRLSDIAVLYRAHFHAMELQMVLVHENIPYVITSGARFFEQAHVKDMCSFLRLLARHQDQMAFVRVLSLLPGIGAKTAEKIWNKAGGSFNARDEACRRKMRSLLPPLARFGWGDIESVFETCGNDGSGSDTGEVIHAFMQKFYEKHLLNTYEDAARRVEDITELSLHVAGFESMEDFLSEVALMTNLDAEIEKQGGATAAGDALRLSTVHQAKGLEWPAVIMLWMADGMFPSARSLKESGEGEAEERRLFYVAVTRAKDELCMCVPELRRKRDGTVMYCSQSRFISEVPRDLVEEHMVGFI